MDEEFELILKTPRVTMERSYTSGDCYHCGNDEAWFMINDNLAELASGVEPKKPQRIIGMEQKAEDVQQAADVELYPDADHGTDSEPEPKPEPKPEPNTKKGKKK